jgi:hypothetical protein
MYVCMYVCMYVVCMYVCMLYVCMYMCVYVYMYVYVCKYVIVVVCMYIRPCVRAYVFIYICTDVENVSTDKMYVQSSKVISSHQKEKFCTKICPKKWFSSLIVILHSAMKTVTELCYVQLI